MEEVVRSQPEVAVNHYNMAILDARRLRFDHARQGLRRALEMMPDYPEAQDALDRIDALDAISARLGPEKADEPTPTVVERADLWSRLGNPIQANRLWVILLGRADARRPTCSAGRRPRTHRRSPAGPGRPCWQRGGRVYLPRSWNALEAERTGGSPCRPHSRPGGPSLELARSLPSSWRRPDALRRPRSREWCTLREEPHVPRSSTSSWSSARITRSTTCSGYTPGARPADPEPPLPRDRGRARGSGAPTFPGRPNPSRTVDLPTRSTHGGSVATPGCRAPVGSASPGTRGEHPMNASLRIFPMAPLPSASSSAPATQSAIRSTASSRCGSRSHAGRVTCSSGPPARPGSRSNRRGMARTVRAIQRRAPSSMGFHDMERGELPGLRALARAYAISDNHHQSVMGGSGPNYIALVTGDVAIFADSPSAPARSMAASTRIRIPSAGLRGTRIGISTAAARRHRTSSAPTGASPEWRRSARTSIGSGCRTDVHLAPGTR